jgi:signal peptidase
VTAAIAVFAMLIVSNAVIPGWHAYTVQGGSMQPEYRQGDLIITTITDAASVQPGQIIVFNAGWASDEYGQRVVHRVVATGSFDGEPVAFTKGDANSVDDPEPVLLSGSVNLVRLTIPSAGATTGPVVAFVLLLLGIAAIAALGLRGLPLFAVALGQLRSTLPGQAAARSTKLPQS